MTKSINVMWVKREKKPCGSDATARKHASRWLQVPVFMLNINLKRFHLQPPWVVVVHSYKEIDNGEMSCISYQDQRGRRRKERKWVKETESKDKKRERSWLLGLIHGYLLDLQTVVRTDGWDGQTVIWVVLCPVVGGNMKRQRDGWHGKKTVKWMVVMAGFRHEQWKMKHVSGKCDRFGRWFERRWWEDDKWISRRRKGVLEEEEERQCVSERTCKHMFNLPDIDTW